MYKEYNKSEVFDIIDSLSVEKQDEFVVTKFNGRVINKTHVSDRYEIFDITSYLKNKISIIESNFEITGYKLKITRGTQYLKLISDKVTIENTEFYKSFYILNSTNKSRRLSFSVGLDSSSNDFYLVRASNTSLLRKHLKGVNDLADSASLSVDTETFNEQIESIRSLVGHSILFSKVRDIILGEKETIPQINHRKFDAFKNSVINKYKDLSKDKIEFLHTYSSDISEVPTEMDFYVDAFWVLKAYLSIFNKQDSHIVRNETERIMNMTKWAIRNSLLESILC